MPAQQWLGRTCAQTTPPQLVSKIPVESTDIDKEASPRAAVDRSSHASWFKGFHRRWRG